MNSDQRPRQQNPRRTTRVFYNSTENNNRNANAPSPSSVATYNRRNGNNRRPSDREDGPSTSRLVHSVFSVRVVDPVDDDGWGEPDPGYWEKKERKEEKKQSRSYPVAQGAMPVGMMEGRNGRGPVHRIGSQPVAQGAARYSNLEVEPQADFGGWQRQDRRERQERQESRLEPQSASVFLHPYEMNKLSLLDSDEGADDGNSSKDSGVAETDDSLHNFCQPPRIESRFRGQSIVDTKNMEKKVEYDHRTALAILKVYSNDLLMETIVSNVTKLSDRSRVEMASSRMLTLSKKAPYLFSKGGDHLHIHFTTFDDFATIQYGSVVRTVPILTMDTRRFDKMEPRMTIALCRILENIGSRFSRKVRKITLGGTTEFYSARGVPDHHLILTYDFLSYLFSTFECVTSLHLINCGLDDGAIDFCLDPVWQRAMARMESMELRTVWADTPNRLPSLLNSVSSNLEQFTLTRFTCKRMGNALLDQLRKANCRLKEMQLVIDEDSADDQMEMFYLLKEVASRTDSLRITVAEVGDGVAPSPKCFDFLARMRDVPNLTELKVYVQPKNAGQFESLVALFRDLEFLSSLRTLHIEGFVDQNWLSVEMIHNLADAFKTGMTYLAQTLEDVSFANFPKPTKYNAHGFKGDRKESAYECLWESMASSIGTRKTRRLALTSVRLEDAHLRKIYNAIRHSAEEVSLKNIRRVTARSVAPLVNGEFLRLRRLEAEIAVEPLVLYNLGEIKKTPNLQYAKFALKRRISNEDHHTKMLKAIFAGVFLDHESPRGPLNQFVEVHHRVPGATPPTNPAPSGQSGSSRTRPANRRARPFDHRTEGYGSHTRTRQPTKLLYGEWD
ncbi:hypothetical protein PENTCL1PPCAC_1813 [Pristionchus entomophagus]|uniref:Uncharacterized protein n=1 Tax=Pristionchus entomophagus TaxID=358040 RepID=A0AAV5S9T1_9BILA|nr:hypothetical protein PENTCL1PPCAC_1813 [Pristionchus entomophagus]